MGPIASVLFFSVICAASAAEPSLVKQLLDVDVRQNEVLQTSKGRSMEEHLEDYIKSHEASFQLPVLGSTFTLGARNLDNDEIDLKINFGDANEARRKKKIKKFKLRKVLTPILIFILIKAVVLIPLALGILGLKAWNAIQLSFASFVVSIALAVWKFCTKISHDAPPPAIIHDIHSSPGWDHDRTDAAQQMAYSAYAPAQ